MSQTAIDPFSMFTFDLSPDLRIPELPGSSGESCNPSCAKKNNLPKCSCPSAPQKGGKKVSSYTKVIHDLAENPFTDEFISWTRDGKFLYVRDSTLLCGELERGKYFRSSKFASIVRNLNYHCFRKLRFDEIDSSLRRELDSVPHLEGARHLFYHPHFQRGRPDLLPMIKSQKTDADKKNLEKKTAVLEQTKSTSYSFSIPTTTTDNNNVGKSEEVLGMFDTSNLDMPFDEKEAHYVNIIAEKDALLKEKDAEIAALRSFIDGNGKRKLSTSHSFDGSDNTSKHSKVMDVDLDYDALFDDILGKQGYPGDHMDADLPALV